VTKKPPKPEKKPAAKASKKPVKRGRPRAKVRDAKLPGSTRRDAGISKVVDSHPLKAEIVAALVEGNASHTEIAKTYGVSRQSITRFMALNLMDRAAREMDERQRRDGAALVNRIERDHERLQKLFDACDDWLRDPANPELYTLCPRMNEIEVVYEGVNGNGNIVNKKALLSTLLARCVPNGDENVVEVKFKQTDPRKLIIDTAVAMRGNIEIIAKLQQIIKDTASLTLNLNFNTHWTALKTIIINATKDSPEVRQAIIDGMEKGLEQEPDK
jgi:hypothetical protein